MTFTMNTMMLNRFLPAGIPRKPSLRRLITPLLLIALAPWGRAENTQPLELRDGDRVVLLGDTLIEREQTFGYLEYVLTTHYPDRHVTFRNLGWSADTPLGASRAGFDTPDKGFERLKEQLTLVKPTVAFIGYGMAASFNGAPGVADFARDLQKLTDTVRQLAGAGIRLVYISPIAHQPLPPPAPDPTNHNAQLALYVDAIRQLADKENAHFANLFQAFTQTNLPLGTPQLTDNGIHLNDYGYRLMSEIVANSLQWESHVWRLGITPNGTVREGSWGMKMLNLDLKADQAKVELVTEQLVFPAPLALGGQQPMFSGKNHLQIVSLKEGRYDVLVDGTFLKDADQAALKGSVTIDHGPEFEQAEELRKTIVKKNELFFHRYRPENNTYLFLFRKHEQGQNAKEIPQFDPLIEETERKIADLRKPRKHVIEVVPSKVRPAPETAVAERPEPARDKTPLPHPQFDTDENIEISLFAENPLLAKPIHINFDPQGRLWVASSEVYPQIKPGQDATDKILLLEDTDGDGRAEKSTVYADGLLIPTGVEPGDGGVYVGQSTELLHFKDVNGDGRADQRRVVLSGFGTEDTHHILHTLRWGPDGPLYMNQSIYIHTHTETPHGVTRLNSGGILGYRAGTMEVGILMKGLVNSWGHAFDRYGQSFATDGASSADPWRGGLNWVIPQAMFLTYERSRRILDSISPGSYPKFCGLEYVRSTHFPDDWQGNFVTCDFRAHRVVRFAVEEKDSAYVTRELPDIVRTKDVAFRPIDIKVGPDGALYIADWSNPIIQHGEVDFRDSRRDHEHGRIWRVAYKGRPLATKTNLTRTPHMALLDALLSTNDFVVRQARRVLLERDRRLILPLLRTWTEKQTTDDARLQALWMYQGLDEVEPALLERLLKSETPQIRAAAVRALAQWQERQPGREGGTTSPEIITRAASGWPNSPLPLPYRKEIPASRALALLSEAIVDRHPRVRVEALRALARIPSAKAAELALSAADKPLDKYSDYALWLTINDLAQPWLAAVKSGEWKPEGREKQLEFALKAIEPASASEILGQLLGQKPLPRDGSGSWIDLIGQAGTARELRQLLNQVLSGGFDERGTANALTALDQAARVRNARPFGDLNPVSALLGNPAEPVKVAAVRLLGAWKLGGTNVQSVIQLAGSANASPAIRNAAFASLRDLGGKTAADALLSFTAPPSPLPLRRQALTTLAAVDFNRSVGPAVEILMNTPDENESLALWRSLLNIKRSAPALARALPKSGIPPVVARAGLRSAREGGRSEPELVLALTRGSGLDEGEVTLTEAEFKQLVVDVGRKGDPARGERVYRRKELSCVACHAIGGSGGKVGPDLTSIGASAPVDYLIESVWFPNKKIKEGFHAVTVETKDGEEYAGVLVRESGEQLVLRDATAKEIVVAKNNIANRRVGTLSLMPAGLIDGVSPDERVDLFRFLSELGKPGTFDATKGNVARTWRIRPKVHTVEQFGEDKLMAAPITDPAWTVAYSQVDGKLTPEMLREVVSVGKYLGLTGIYVGARLQLTKDSPVTFRLIGDPEAVWIDGKPVKGGLAMPVELTAGAHAVVLRLDPRKLPEAVRLESSEGTFLTD
jgi:putative heme-binding domain-containing protein